MVIQTVLARKTSSQMVTKLKRATQKANRAELFADATRLIKEKGISFAKTAASFDVSTTSLHRNDESSCWCQGWAQADPDEEGHRSDTQTWYLHDLRRTSYSCPSICVEQRDTCAVFIPISEGCPRALWVGIEVI